MKKTIFDRTNRRNAPKKLLGIMALALLMLVSVAGAAPFAYVANDRSNSVSVIDTKTNTVTTTVPVGIRPDGVAVTPDGTKAYVANWGSDSVSVIDTKTNTVTTTVPVTGPDGVAVTPDGTKAYVTSIDRNSVFVIDTKTNTVTTAVPVGISPDGVAVTPDGTKAYVANQNSDSVSVIDTKTNTVTTAVPVGALPCGVAVTPDGTKAYVTNIYSNSVSAIDTKTDTVTTTVRVGTNPWGVAITPNGTKAYVANANSNSVSVIDTKTDTVTTAVRVGISPRGVAVTPDGTKAYVTNIYSKSVSVIDTKTNTVTTTVPVGEWPIAIGQFIVTCAFPVITTQPQDVISCAGTEASFSVTASGTGLTFQWMKDNSPLSDGQTISGTTSSELSLSSVQGSNAGAYTVDVTNSCGITVTSTGATLTVNTPPAAPSRQSGPKSGYAFVPYSYTTSTTDPDSDQVKYIFDWGDGTTFVTDFVNSGPGTSASASHAWSKAGTFQVRTSATNGKCAPSGWSNTLTVTIATNSPPNAPFKPIGYVSGTPGTSYRCLTSAIDQNNDKVKYTFDWGDKTTSVTDLIYSGGVKAAYHKWGKAGVYQVKAMANDIKGAPSDWSKPLEVTIDSPPNRPSKPTGPASGKIGTSYSYTTSTTDPDGDQFKYTFDWGDGTTFVTDFVKSGPGTSASTSHAWSKAGTFRVRTKATDGYGVSSGWSSSLTVKIS